MKHEDGRIGRAEQTELETQEETGTKRQPSRVVRWTARRRPPRLLTLDWTSLTPPSRRR
ncbi:MAG: hypothetical protein WD737_14760 [Gemmatimonadota bacterium]